jgi:hypothetical protein
MRILQELLSLREAKGEYSSFKSWKAAIKKKHPDAWIEGDEDIAQAMVGPKPYKRGETKAVGEWDGAKGELFEAKDRMQRARNAAEMGRGQSAADFQGATKFEAGDKISFIDDSVTPLVGRIVRVLKKGSKVPDGLKAYMAYDKVGGLQKVPQENVDHADCYVVDAAPSEDKDPRPVLLTMYKFQKVKKLSEEALAEAGEEKAMASRFKAEYEPVLKAHGFKRQPSGKYYKTSGCGEITITKHGHWEHLHVGDTDNDKDYEGTTARTLDRHLASLGM